LIQRGIKTIRYKNEQVLNNLKEVKIDLIKQIDLRLKNNVASPPLVKGGCPKGGWVLTLKRICLNYFREEMLTMPVGRQKEI